MSVTAETDSESPIAKRLTLVAMSLGFAVVQLDVSVVNVAVKTIGSDLGGGLSGLQWVVNAYTIAFAAFILTAGALGDLFGARRMFVGGFALFLLASAACGLAPTLPVLVGARAIQGVGAAILVPSSLTLLNHAYPEAGDRARAVGLYLAGASLALSGGPLVGGALIAAAGWRAIFFINVPIALFGIALTLRYASDTTRSRDRGVDLPGQLAAIATLVLLVGATIEGGNLGFGAPLVLGGFAAALVAGAGFVLVESRVARPMLPLSLFRSRVFSLASAIGLCANTGFYGLIFVLSLLFQREQHLSPLSTGLALLPIMVGVTSANVVSGRLTARFGEPRLIIAGIVVLGAGCAGLFGVEASTPFAVMIAPLVAMGLGGGTVIPVITSALMGSVERSRSGVAAGTLNTLRQTGSAIGVALFGALISGGSAARFFSGAHLSLAIVVGLSVVIVALAALMARR